VQRQAAREIPLRFKNVEKTSQQDRPSDAHTAQEQGGDGEVQGSSDGMSNVAPDQHGEGDAADVPSSVSFLLIHGYDRYSLPVATFPTPTVSPSCLYWLQKVCTNCPDRPRAAESGRSRGRSFTTKPSPLPSRPTPSCCCQKFEGRSSFGSIHQ
jgi:hypothetical protein